MTACNKVVTNVTLIGYGYKFHASVAVKIINSYFLVGTANYLSEYFEMLDGLLLLFFRGASDLFHKDGGKIIRKTKYKAPLKPETVKFFETDKIWEIENEFYNFVQTTFNTLYNDFKRVKNQASSIKLRTKKDK